MWSQAGDEALGKVEGQQPQSRKSSVEEGKGMEYEGSVGGVVKEQPHQELPQWLQHTKYTHYPNYSYIMHSQRTQWHYQPDAINQP